MANVPHSGLTGTDLHESKGTAAAAVDTVFVADGAGSGTYKKVPNSALSALSNPFGASLLHVREAQANGGSGLSPLTTNTFVTTWLNTVVTNEISGASLSTAQLTLPIGTYYIDAVIPWFIETINPGTWKFKSALFNLTTSAFLVTGQMATTITENGGHGVTMSVPLRGRFSLASTNIIVLQHYKSNGQIGFPASVGNEIYAEACIWKVS